MEGKKFNFIIDCSDSEIEKFVDLQPSEAAKVFVRGDLNWCLQTYLILLKRGNLPIQCSNKILPNVINLIHSDQLLKLKR